MGDTATGQAQTTSEIAAAIAEKEKEGRQDVLTYEQKRAKKYQDLLDNYPYVGLLPADSVDFNKTYPGLFPKEVFNPDGSRKSGMKTKAEKMAEASSASS